MFDYGGAGLKVFNEKDYGDREWFVHKGKWPL